MQRTRAWALPLRRAERRRRRWPRARSSLVRDDIECVDLRWSGVRRIDVGRCDFVRTGCACGTPGRGLVRRSQLQSRACSRRECCLTLVRRVVARCNVGGCAVILLHLHSHRCVDRAVISSLAKSSESCCAPSQRAMPIGVSLRAKAALARRFLRVARLAGRVRGAMIPCAARCRVAVEVTRVSRLKDALRQRRMDVAMQRARSLRVGETRRSIQRRHVSMLTRKSLRLLGAPA
jgi:hypothetical protein